MNHQDIYRDNVILSRRDRSRRALFWSRIVGIVLMLCIGVILRSEPQLRQDLMIAGMDAIAKVTGTKAGPSPAAPEGDAVAAQNDQRPRDRIKVNRYGAAPQELDAQGLADQVGKTLSSRPVGG